MSRIAWRWLFAAMAIAPALASGPGEAAAAESIPERIEFNRDVRPILADACFHCHGPDARQRQAELRFDHEAGAKADLGDGRRAIVPGKPDASELVRRITSPDPERRMPPPEAERQLSPRQIAVLRKWIEQGATWQRHWAFLPPSRPRLPEVTGRDRVRNPIDHFVLARLESEGLSFAPDADRATLLRRVTLDLTGLPPAPDEVAAFVADESPNAYEKVLDRLLESPRYGERMASRWLDGARYADTSGYQSDGDRVMWRWRDWVIDAFNADMPFDQFTIEQLAGDLLPNATLDQKLATGFNRNHRGNGEGGIIPEEYAVEYVVDRVETTTTVWLGVTMMCVRCHDHKYDPFAQQEFYQLFAFFNNVPEKGRAVKYGNSPPYLLTPTRDQQAELDRLDRELATAENSWAALQPVIARGVAGLDGSAAFPDDTPTRGLMLYYNLNQDAIGQVLPSGRARPAVYPGADRMLEEAAVPNGNLRHGIRERVIGGANDRDGFVAGKIDSAFDGDGKRFLHAGDVAKLGFYDRFSIGAWIRPRGVAGGTIVSRMADVPRGAGYAVTLEKGRVQAQFQVRWLDDAMRVETVEPIPADRWSHVLVTYDGSREAAGVAVYVDGNRRATRVLLDELNQSFESKEPLRIGGGHGPRGRFHGLIDEVRLYDVVLSEDEAAALGAAETLAEVVRTPQPKRTSQQIARLRAAYVAHVASDSIRTAWQRLHSAREARQRYVDLLPTTMVMAEMETPRETHVLIRGEYDKPGERVGPGIPAALAGGAATGGRFENRLDLAKWLVDPANPLTARVAVNRMWQQLFGTGIVRTVDDFGIQGEWPSHPELLDWLAVEMGGREPGDRSQESGESPRPISSSSPSTLDARPSSNPQSTIGNPQSLKRLLRLIVTSTAYRQSSRATAELLQRDPDNRLLARGPRFRLPAEMIRDQALFASGLLVERLGGPSVKPYQPEGLYKDLAGTEYEPGHGDDLYRRSLYTYWKRTIAPPAMVTFDAAGRETCVVRETRTNTPLQALNLMNDVTYVEASRFLAERMLREGGTAADRVRFGFVSVTGRAPRPRELAVLSAGLERHLAHYRGNAEAADRLTKTGERPRDGSLDIAELAGYTALAGLLLNLDETVTRE